MSSEVEIVVNGRRVSVPEGVSVAIAIFLARVSRFRQSVSGEPRAPLCGMGICFECRATIDGLEQQRTCQLPVRAGMEVRTSERMGNEVRTG